MDTPGICFLAKQIREFSSFIAAKDICRLLQIFVKAMSPLRTLYGYVRESI